METFEPRDLMRERSSLVIRRQTALSERRKVTIRQSAVGVRVGGSRRDSPAKHIAREPCYCGGGFTV